MFNNFGQIINRVCRCDPGDDSHDQMTGRQWISNHEVLVSRKCTGNEEPQLRLKTFNNFGWFIWHKCNCNSDLLTIHELNNYGTIVNCKSTCRQKVPVQISPQSLHYAGSPGHQATLATTPNSLTHQQLNGSHEVVSPRPPQNSSIAISNLQPQTQEISLPRPVEISPIGQPNTMTTRRLCGSCRILENLPKLSDNHSFQNQQPQINSVMNKENHEQPSSNPIFLKRKAESFASQENPSTRQKVESIVKSPENQSIMQSPKPTKFQNFKSNSSNVQIRIIPQSTTQQQMKSRNIATNSHFSKILPRPSMASSVSLNSNQYLGSWIKVKNPHLPEAAVAKSGKSKLSFLQEDSYQKDMHKVPPEHNYSKLVLKPRPLFYKNMEPEPTSPLPQKKTSKTLDSQEIPPKHPTVVSSDKQQLEQNQGSTIPKNTSHFTKFKFSEKMKFFVSSLINNTLETTVAFTLDKNTNSKLLVSPVKSSPSSNVQNKEMFPSTDLLSQNMLKSTQPTKVKFTPLKSAKRSLLAEFNQPN